MYANADTVRSLCRNIRSSVPDDEIAAIATLVDAELDGELGRQHYWPTGSDGSAVSPVPPLIGAISSFLVAALLCQGKYAQNESGGAEANPYAVALDRRGRAILNRILKGEQMVPGLQRVGEVATRPTTTTYAPVHGLRGGARWP